MEVPFFRLELVPAGVHFHEDGGLGKGNPYHLRASINTMRGKYFCT
jgi:hypothetical protein